MSPQTATCPCGGSCHHDERPCSLGCWSAQKPWRPEEAQALVLDALETAVQRPPNPSDRTYYEEGWLDLKARVLEVIQQQRSKP